MSMQSQGRLVDEQQSAISLPTPRALCSTAVLSSSSLPGHLENSSLQSDTYVRDGASTNGQCKSSEEESLGVSKQIQGRVCGGCGTFAVKSEFSKTQWRRKQDSGSVCLSCTARVAGSPSTEPGRRAPALTDTASPLAGTAASPRHDLARSRAYLEPKLSLSAPSDSSPRPSDVASAGRARLPGAGRTAV